MVVITQMDYINPFKLFCLEVGCFKSYVTGTKRDQLGNFFQNRVIATAGKSRL